MIKRCGKCKQEFSTDSFCRNRSTEDGLADYCKLCHNAYYKKWRSKNIEKARRIVNESIAKIKLEVMTHYGLQCACCGEDEYTFLTLDHINNDGAEHRKSLSDHFARRIYLWARKNNYPSSLQTLCMNCNWGKRMNSGVCPHALKEALVT